jgi:putative ABC transport system permease protein
LFDLLLRLLPFDFQRDYGGEMQDVFRDEHQAAQSAKQPLATTRLWGRTILGVLAIAPREHFDNLRSDVGFAVRSFRKRPGFALISIATLGLAIGANTAIFSVVNGVMLRPFPYPAIDRILMLNEINERDGTNFSVSYSNFKDWASANTSFEHLGIYRQSSANLTGDGPAERLNVAYVSSAIFGAMGIRPLQGRTFSIDDDRSGAAPTVVISQRLWESRFASSPSIVGQTMLLNGINHQVAGVMPSGMRFPSRLTDVWLPFGLLEGQLPASRGAHPNLWVVGRLKADVSVERATTEMGAIADRLSATYPDSNTGNGIRIVPYYELVVQNIRPMLVFLFGAVASVLLIACVNLTNLMLARAESRRHEMAVRASLGAGRGRLIRQLLTESVVLSAAGAGVGLALAYGAVAALIQMAPSNIPRLDQIRVDGTVLAFVAAVSLTSALLSGLVPAIRASRSDLQGTLRDGGKGAGSRERRRLRASLVVVEVALALVVLVGTGLALRGFERLTKIDVGFDPERVISGRVDLPAARYATDDAWIAFHLELVRRLQSIPGVHAAGLTNAVPMGGSGAESGIIPEGRPLRDPDTPTTGSTFFAVSPDYFRVMGIRLLAGRSFTEHDDRSAPLVAVVDERLAQSFWPNENALGKRVAFEFDGTDREPRPIWREVVGVVSTVRYYGLTVESPRVQIYTPVTQLALWFSQRHPPMAFALKANVPVESVLPQVRREVAAIDRDLPVHSIVAAADLIAEQTSSSRLSMWLMMLFGLLALSLAVVGVYGMMSYVVNRRTQEFGLRLALGATRANVFRLVFRQTLLLLGPGLLLGLAGGAIVARFARDMFYGVSPSDPLTFAGVSMVLAAVGLFASYVPARRAVRVDPVTALRAD